MLTRPVLTALFAVIGVRAGTHFGRNNNNYGGYGTGGGGAYGAGGVPFAAAPGPFGIPSISKAAHYQLPPVYEHDVVVLSDAGKMGGSPVEVVLRPAVADPPSLVQMMPPPPSPYVPPVLVDLPPAQRFPAIIHASPYQAPAVPAILPSKETRISSKAYTPVAVLRGPSKASFHPVAPVPGKQGPRLPHTPTSIRPVRKGEM